MKVRYHCSDICNAMVRDIITLDVSGPEEACSEENWQRAKRKFARKYKTQVKYVDITGVEREESA